VKGFSILLKVPFFDLIENCPLESLHCLWEGIVKQFCDLWFNSKYHNHNWYIGKPNLIGNKKIAFILNILATMNKRMGKIEIPHYLKKPVDLSNRSGWKGNKLVYFINSEAIDFKYWAIYYSMYVVKGETNNDVINCY